MTGLQTGFWGGGGGGEGDVIPHVSAASRGSKIGIH